MSDTIIINTPDGITFYRLAAQKGAIRLEKIGLRHSRGSVRKVAALEYGLKPNAKHDEVIAEIQKRMDALMAKAGGK